MSMWQEVCMTGDVPIPRSSHTLTVCDGKIFLFGGELAPRTAADNDVFMLDLDNRKWIKCATSGEGPCPKFAHCTAAVDNKLYVYGGRTGIGADEGVSDDVFVLDTKTFSWSKLSVSGDVPETRSYSFMVSFGRNLYMFGGYAPSGRKNDLYSFNVDTNTWAKLPSTNEICPRGGPGLGIVTSGSSASLYVIGGFNGNEMDDAYRFDIDTNTWEKLVLDPNIPPTSVFALATCGSKLVLHGGEIAPCPDGHAGAGIYTNDTFVLDTEAGGGWKKVDVSGSAPLPRGWLPAVSLPNPERLIIFGGNSPTNERLGDVHVLTL